MNFDFQLMTWVGLISTPLLIAAGQVLFKLASRNVGDFGASGLFHLLLDPYLLIALVLYGSGTIVWIYVLKNVPLGIAYSFMALTFCVVPILAHFVFGEPLQWKYAVGVMLIVAGMLMINTQQAAAAA